MFGVSAPYPDPKRCPRQPGTWSPSSLRAWPRTSWPSTGSTLPCPSCRTQQRPWRTSANGSAASPPVSSARPHRHPQATVRSRRFSAQAKLGQCRRIGFLELHVALQACRRNSGAAVKLLEAVHLVPLDLGWLTGCGHFDRLVGVATPTSSAAATSTSASAAATCCSTVVIRVWTRSRRGRGLGHGHWLLGGRAGAPARSSRGAVLPATGASAAAASGRLVAVGSDRRQGGGGDRGRCLAETDVGVDLLRRHLGSTDSLGVLLTANGADLHDIVEFVGDRKQVGAGVRSEADDLAPHAFVLQGADGGREVSVAGDDDRHVHPLGQPEQVDHELDVEVGLDPPVAELPDVLGYHPVAVLAQEVQELLLVLVLGIKARVGIGANEIAPLGGVLQQRHVVDVHVLAAGGVVEVGNVNKDGHVLAHVSSTPCV